MSRTYKQNGKHQQTGVTKKQRRQAGKVRRRTEQQRRQVGRVVIDLAELDRSSPVGHANQPLPVGDNGRPAKARAVDV